MRRLSISAAWEETKLIFVRDGRLLTTVALALIVLPQVILAVVGSPIGANATALARFVYIAVILVGFVAQITLIRLAIGPSVTVRDAIAQGLLRVLPVFLVLLVVAIALGIVTTVLAIPMGLAGLATIKNAQAAPSIVLVLLILVALTFAIIQLIFPIAALETGNPIRLVSRSWQLSRGNYLRLLAFVVMVVIGLGLILVAMQFGLGSVIVLLLGRPNPGSVASLVLGLLTGVLQAAFTMIAAVMLARIYLQLTGTGAQPSVPSSGI